MPTPGAAMFGFSDPSYASPSDEKLATMPRPVFVAEWTAPTETPTSSPARCAASSSTASAEGMTTAGAVASSDSRSDPAGSDAP